MKALFCHAHIQQSPFVAQFAKALGMPSNTLRAKSILSALFQTIRERIPLFASRTLVAYLPNEIKPLYLEEWQNEFSTKFDYKELINDLCKLKGLEHSDVFHCKREVETAVSAFFETLKAEIEDYQYEDLMSFMPISLRVNLMNDYVFDGHSYFYN